MISEATINVAVPASLADYTQPALIVLRLREGDTAGIISELSQLLHREGGVPTSCRSTKPRSTRSCSPIRRSIAAWRFRTRA